MFFLIGQNIIRHEKGLVQSYLMINSSQPHRYSRKFGVLLAELVLVIGAMSQQTAAAQTFDIASGLELTRVCENSTIATEQLRNVCQQLGFPNNGNGASSGVGTQSQPNPILISQQQLKELQTREEREKMPSGSADTTVTSHWGDKFSTFLTAGATALHHRKNDYEQAYNATIPSVTLGGGYHITDALLTGLAFNYSNSTADNDSGGGFNVNSYTPLLYVSYLPFDNAFANLVLGYSRQNQENNRVAVAANTTRPDIAPVSRSTQGNLNANQYDLNFLSGYDHPIENMTLGPRVGLDVRQWEMNSYQEKSNTGLELSYNSQYQTSIQSTLGLAASYAHSTAYGVLVPQLTASWVHEYSNNSRVINARFVQTSDFATSRGFFFQTETPARNWAVIDLGVSFVMPKGVQAFVNFSTVQGNRNFESYGGNVGMQVGW